MEHTNLSTERRFGWIDGAVWVAVALLALARFVHLGYGDLKDFDECLYAWRSKLVLYRGDWLDQSEYAWGGYWSAAFPPLQVWVTAIFFNLFGFSEFVARLYSALTGAGSVVFLFLMGRRLNRDRWTGLLAALLIGSVWFFTVYSRRDQFDVPVAFYITLSLYAYVGYLDRVRIAGRRRVELERGARAWLVLSGLAVGLGLMNKIGQAITASIVIGGVALYAWLRGRHSFRRLITEQIIINGVAFAVIFPWHLAMTFWAKTEGFWDWYINYHLLSRTADTLHGDVGAWYYYLARFWDQLSAPMIALSLIAVPYSAAVIVDSLRKRQDRSGDAEDDRGRPLDHRDLRYGIPLFWFGFQLLLFSAAGTKRETYTIAMYPPLCLLCAVFLGERLVDLRRLKLLAATLFSVAVFCTLSRMKTLGRQLEAALANPDRLGYYDDVLARLAVLVGSIAAGTVLLYLLLRRRHMLFHRVALSIILVATTIFSLREARRVLHPEKGTRWLGWQQIRPYLDRKDYRRLVFVGKYTDPEAMYYFNGLNPPFHVDSEIEFTHIKEYDKKILDSIASKEDVRVVTMRSWLEKQWTPDERRKLLERLELIADSGNEFAIYRPKR